MLHLKGLVELLDGFPSPMMMSEKQGDPIQPWPWEKKSERERKRDWARKKRLLMRDGGGKIYKVIRCPHCKPGASSSIQVIEADYYDHLTKKRKLRKSRYCFNHDKPVRIPLDMKKHVLLTTWNYEEAIQYRTKLLMADDKLNGHLELPSQRVYTLYVEAGTQSVSTLVPRGSEDREVGWQTIRPILTN